MQYYQHDTDGVEIQVNISFQLGGHCDSLRKLENLFVNTLPHPFACP